VTYRIAQGRQRFIREVMFRGAKHTRDRVVRREVGMLPGQMADSKEITKSLNRLYSTNYFLDEMTPEDHKDPTYHFIPTDDPDWVDLEYLVEEGRVVNFMIQAAIDSNSGLFGRLSLSMRNFDVTNTPDNWVDTFGDIYDKEAFHGAGQLLNLEISPGTEIDYYRVRFVEPDLFRTEFNRYGLELEFLRRTSTTADFYTEDRTNRQIEIGREFGRELWMGVGYTNQILDVTDIEAPLVGIVEPDGTTVPPQIFEQEGESDLIGGLFEVRYHNVDTTLNTREGVTVNWKNGFYGGAFGGDYEFYKSDLDFEWRTLLGPPDVDAAPGFRFSAGVGIGDAYGESTAIPYTERYFLGGRTTLRGFEYRGVGPNYNGEPLGGETSMNATAQFHFPLYSVVQPGSYRAVEMFYGVLFVDAGVLDPDPYRLDFNELRASVGFGFGMARPLPLILNFGFPIREGDGDSTEVLSFSISYMSF
jgi:outer membrane protein insertion porin family